jgi:hypothetical protein
MCLAEREADGKEYSRYKKSIGHIIQVAPLSMPLKILPRCPAIAINKTAASAREI